MWNQLCSCPIYGAKRERISFLPDKSGNYRCSFVILLLVAMFLSACAGEVTGHVFLDKNNNEKLDSDEKGISKALYEVERDGQPLTSGMTDENGMFFFKKTEKGDYCVKIINTSDQYTTTTPQLTKEPVAGKASKAATDTTTTTGTTGTTATTTGTTSTTGEEAEQKETQKPLPAAKSLQNCIRLTGYSDGGIVNVFVGQDVAASIATIPAAADIIVSPGNTFELKFWLPNRCKLIDTPLPYKFSFANNVDENILTSSNLELNKSEAIIPYTLTEMAIVPAIAKLKAPDIIGKEATYTIKLQVKCPDGNAVALNDITIKVQKERTLFVTQEIKEKKAAFEGTLTLTTNVNNKGEFDFHDDAVLTITMPEASEIVSISNQNCRAVLTQVQCDINNIKKDEGFTVTAKIKLPPAASYLDGYSSKIETELDYYDTSVDEEAAENQPQDIKIDIAPPAVE